MKLILKKAVENLGDVGAIVNVKAGYGRNYLLPQGIAYEASPANLRRIEEEQKQAEERSRRDYLEARRRASQLADLALTFLARAGEDGKLFGSVTNGDIAERLNGLGKLDFELDKRSIQLEEPIKSLGETSVRVHLFADVDVEIAVTVEREEG